MTFDDFPEIVVLDSEFHTGQVRGNRPVPVCICALGLRSRRRYRIWCEPGASIANPFRQDALFVAFSASAEWSCFRQLGWQLPYYVLDLYAEFRCHTNGFAGIGSSLIDAMGYYGCPAMARSEKQGMRNLILGGGPFSGDDREAILDYCMTDVDGTAELLSRMQGVINVPAALERGRYTKAASAMEWHGIPIDVPLLRALQERWQEFRVHLVEEVENEYGFGLYRVENSEAAFSYRAFEAFLVREGLSEIWERIPGTNRPKLTSEYFKTMATAFPRLEPLRVLRKTLAGLPTLDPPVGQDGRNRSSIRSFAAKTSRNQPRTREMVMGFPAWLRSLMCAEPGHALIYVDLSSAEFGIAAGLSRDPAMMQDYRQGDPYLSFGKRMSVLPTWATKETYRQGRERLKSVCLGALYGMGHQTLATKLQVSVIEAKDLLRLHRRAYPQYWSFLDRVLEVARFEQQVWTALDWRLNNANRQKANTVRNFLMQATCADILRLTCSVLTESGLEVVAPFHDAVLIHAPVAEVDHVLEMTRATWALASAELLDGFELRSDVDRNKAVFEFPRPYLDGRQADFFMKAVEFVRPEDRGLEQFSWMTNRSSDRSHPIVCRGIPKPTHTSIPV